MGQIKVTKAPIEGLYVIEPTVHGDDRGYFMETYNLNDMKEAGLDMNFVQDNQSMSTKGVLRGLHFQKKYPQGKLVRAIKGRVFDVAVDLRSDSETYGQWYGVELTEENKKQFYISEGFAHGFLVLSDTAEFCYKCTDFYHPGDEGGAVVVKKGTLIQKATTGADGTAKFTADLPLGFSYDVKEMQAPEGYVRNTEDVYTFAFSYTNDKEAKQTFKHTFKNERVTAKISLQKQDKETKKAVPQGDATLEKAVYGLYAREDIVHPDGATGVVYKAGEQVATLTTDKNGQASVDGLYLGNYYVKEITPPTGYLADEEEHDLVCNYEGDLVAEVKRDCLSLEQVMKQPFQIIKAANNGKTDADLLKGAGFTAYLVSSLKVNEDGSYDFDSAKPVVIGENGATEIFTDEKGYACSIAIP